MASEKVTTIVEELKTLTVLELSELVSAVEEEFGVSAAAAVAVAAPAEGGAAAAEEKTEFDVVLAEVGANKIQVIKAVLKHSKNSPRNEKGANLNGANNANLSDSNSKESKKHNQTPQDSGEKKSKKK